MFDDMLIFGIDVNISTETKNFLSSKFDVKNLGEVDIILGIKLTKVKSGLRI